MYKASTASQSEPDLPRHNVLGRKETLTVRGKLLASALGILAATGLISYGIEANKEQNQIISKLSQPKTQPLTGPHYSHEQLDQMVQRGQFRWETIQNGGGAYDAVKAADPEIVADYGRTTEDLVAYVNTEAPDPNDPMTFQAGEKVKVPAPTVKTP